MSETPMITCSLSRKVNLGNYETCDIGMSVTLPLESAEATETISETIDRIAAKMYKDLSSQVSERYRYLKAMQSGGYQMDFEEWREKQAAKAGSNGDG